MGDKVITVEEQQAEIENLKLIVEDLQKDVADLKLKQAATAGSFIKQAAEKKKPEIPKETVKYEGKKYQWLKAAFRFSGSDERYTAEEAATDTAIIKRILDIKGQNILKELV